MKKETVMKANEVPTRPYFLPKNINYGELPEDLQIAIDEVFAPAYQELVVEAPSNLERAAATGFILLLLVELMEQFQVGSRISEGLRQGIARQPLFSGNELDHYLKILSAKERAGKFLLQVRRFRIKHGDVFSPLDNGEVGETH
jgi:hypothetical protein